MMPKCRTPLHSASFLQSICFSLLKPCTEGFLHLCIFLQATAELYLQQVTLQFLRECTSCLQLSRMLVGFTLSAGYKFLVSMLHMFAVSHLINASCTGKIDLSTTAKNISESCKVPFRGIIVCMHC